MRRRLRLLVPIAVVVAVALVVAGCGGGGGQKKVAKEAVAVVGDVQITRVEFDALLEQAKASYKVRNRPFPTAGSPEYETLKNQAIGFLVRRSEFEQKARKLGISVSDKRVADRLAQLKQQYFGGSERRYQDGLKLQGLTDQEVRRDIRSQLISEEIFKQVTGGVKVSETDVKAFYGAHKAQFGQPASRDVRHILVNNQALALKLYQQLKGGADFGGLAKRYSLDPGSKQQGGRLTVSKGQTVPEFDRVAFSLKVNEISPPVKTQFGWHVIQALSTVRAPKEIPFSQVSDSIKAQLLQTKRNDAMTKWVDQVTKEFSSKVRYQAGYTPPTAVTTGTSTSR